jgi:hypothetical protein
MGFENLAEFSEVVLGQLCGNAKALDELFRYLRIRQAALQELENERGGRIQGEDFARPYVEHNAAIACVRAADSIQSVEHKSSCDTATDVRLLA